jgi:hypothetical protein
MAIENLRKLFFLALFFFGKNRYLAICNQQKRKAGTLVANVFLGHFCYVIEVAIIHKKI